MQTKKFNVMRHLRLLLFILMAFVATNAALAINNLKVSQTTMASPTGYMNTTSIPSTSMPS